MLASPYETGIGVLMILSSIPVYYLFIYWTNKPQWFNKTINNVTILLQKVFIVVGKSKSAKL